MVSFGILEHLIGELRLPWVIVPMSGDDSHQPPRPLGGGLDLTLGLLYTEPGQASARHEELPSIWLDTVRVWRWAIYGEEPSSELSAGAQNRDAGANPLLQENRVGRR